MVSPAMLIVALVIAIAIILFCIIVLKLNASIGMVLASLFMGVAGGLDLMTTMDTISSGFGSMMTSIGLPVGFGTILGQLMSDSGAADIIADKLVSAFPEKRSIWGLSLAGFVLSIPVFFDVTFIILIPIGITIAVNIADVIFSNLPKCKADIYKLLSGLSGMSAKDIAALPMPVFMNMVVDTIKKEEFKDFFWAAARLFK